MRRTVENHRDEAPRDPSGRSGVWARYLLLQAPGWTLLALAAYLLRVWASLPAWVCWIVLVFWIAKDLALFPLVRRAYEKPNAEASRRLVGARALAVQRLDPGGYVRIGQELWRAEAGPGEAPVEEGEPLRVRDVDGLTVLVTRDRTAPEGTR